MSADFLTIAQASRLIARRELSPVEMLRTCLARLDRMDGQLHSFVTVTRELALQEACKAEAEILRGELRGPMHGIPYGLKDIFETKGIRTTAQSRLLADHVPAADCDARERLSAAGGVLMGKTATWEFAHGGPSWDILQPPARNPWNPEYDTAGSSSGSAAAIAAGICPAAMGSDTGGSIRSPAAACGVAGLKPTYGRVSRRGVLPNSFTQDHCGPMAWTVEDLAIILNVIAGYDPRDPASANVPVPNYRVALTGSVEGLVIGVPYAWIEQQAPASAETRAAFDRALAVFQDLGASVREITLPPAIAYEDTKRTIAIAELFAIHEGNLRTRPELFGASLRYRIIAGGLVRAEDYIQALRMRTSLARQMQQVFDAVDVLMLPTAEPPGKLEPQPHEKLFTSRGYNSAFNVSGNPALALTMGFNADGLPFSLQIVGRLFDEATVLRAGDCYEKATSWRDRRPPIAVKAPVPN